MLMLYTLIALCGFGAGWCLGSEGVPWLGVPCLLGAAWGSWLLCCRPAVVSPEAATAGFSHAHRAWFASSGACMLVLLLVWVAFGWTLPSLSLDGLRLDPVGALGWDATWLLPRLEVAQWLLLAGLLGLLAALAWWGWQKHSGKRPRVALGWVFAPFFWMASLGMLVAISQPWRTAPSHALADRWHAGMPPKQTALLAMQAMDLAQADGAAAVWAHALALKAYQQGQMDRVALDAFLVRLASANTKRHHASIFRAASIVGVDNQEWCMANAARTTLAAKDWVQAQKRCQDTPPGRLWEWSAR